MFNRYTKFKKFLLLEFGISADDIRIEDVSYYLEKWFESPALYNGPSDSDKEKILKFIQKL